MKQSCSMNCRRLHVAIMAITDEVSRRWETPPRCRGHSTALSSGPRVGFPPTWLHAVRDEYNLTLASDASC